MSITLENSSNASLKESFDDDTELLLFCGEKLLAVAVVAFAEAMGSAFVIAAASSFVVGDDSELVCIVGSPSSKGLISIAVLEVML